MCPNEEKQISVLVAEDHPPLREMIAAILNNAGYRVMTAESGDEALRIANESVVDLLLTDLRMPGLSASSLIDQFQANSRGSGVVVMSGDIAVASPILNGIGSSSSKNPLRPNPSSPPSRKP